MASTASTASQGAALHFAHRTAEPPEAFELDTASAECKVQQLKRRGCCRREVASTVQALLAKAQQHATLSAQLSREQRWDLARSMQACGTACGQDLALLGAWAPRLEAMLALGQGLLQSHLVQTSQVCTWAGAASEHRCAT